MTWLADHSLRVAAMIVVVGAGCLLARRASAHSRLFAWSVVLYTAAAMPLFAAVLPDVSLPLTFGDSLIVVPQHEPVGIQPALQAQTGPAASQSPTSLPWLIAIYLAVAGFLFTRIVAGMRQTTRVLRRAQPITDSTLLADVHALSSALQLSRVPAILQHASVHVPFVCGLLRPALVLPDSWNSWDSSTRQAVLTHELSHIVRRDLWTMRAASLYRAATWISPMSWWLRRKLETEAERASDEAVLAAGVEPTAYAEILMQFFDAAQRAPGRASWELAMARRGGAEASKRVGRVLSAREGGNVRLGMPGRVVVGMGVVLAAVPAMVVSASRVDAVAIQRPEIVDLGLGLRPFDELRVVPSTVEGPQAQATPSTSRGENQAELDRTQAALRTTHAELRLVEPSQRRVTRTPAIALNQTAVPQAQQEQEQEPEPWRSTRKASDADVVAPRLTRSVHARYTPDAMRAKIQGLVAVEVIVSPEGYVTAARVSKSLDKDFGLDEEALKAARQWTFMPGTYQGQAVAVRVMIELEFRLH